MTGNVTELLRTTEMLWPLTYIVGVLVSWVYYRKQGKAIISLLLIYFALGIYSSTLAPYVNRLSASRYSTEITAEQLERYEAYQKELDALHLKYPEIAPGTLVKHVSFPLGQILLVTTLFILGRQLEKNETIL
ncbi:MAG TPA: hypothetical protein PK251_15920 [Candidatus Latescibacteria bacterium]|nr:hypothetical protein [Candidatus Latescibacterota bacterium]